MDNEKRFYIIRYPLSIIHLILSLLLISCGGEQRAGSFPPENQFEPEMETSKTETDKSNAPRSIKISVSISRREDLHVSAGDKLKSGDVIADRSKERNALLEQKRAAETALRRLYALQKSKNEDLRKPVIPDASFAEPEAAIRRAAVAVQAAKRAADLQEQRIKEIEKLPFPGDLSKVKEHETARLELLKGELLAAESNLALERAKLETAKANRNYSEQKDALEISRQKITQYEQRITLETQITQTEAVITNLDSQILLLSAVRAPFAGTVKKIIWEGQNNGEINVVITVDVSDSDNRANAEARTK